MPEIYLPIVIKGDSPSTVPPYPTVDLPPKGIEHEGTVQGFQSFLTFATPILTKFSVKLEELYPTYPNEFILPDRVKNNIALLGDNAIYINIKLTPEWARELPDDPKSPPKREYWSVYADAAINLKSLYPQIKLISFLNEPNMPQEISNPDYFGCWMYEGEAFTPTGFYDAGVRYGEFMHLVGCRVKEYHPDLLIGAGELLSGVDPRPSVLFNFVEGMLTKSPVYDVNCFHPYFYYYHTLTPPEYKIKLSPEGVEQVFLTAFTIAKNLYDITKKLSIFSEVALLKKQSLADQPDFAYEGGHLVEFMDRIIRTNEYPVASYTWYALINPWEWCGMLNYPSKTPRPSYNEFIRSLI